MNSEKKHPLDQYVLAVAANQLDDAKLHLLEALTDANDAHSLPMKAGIAQRLARVLAQQGDAISAKILYALSEDIDSGSLLAKLEHAKFLNNQPESSEDVIKKCDEIIYQANLHHFEETDDDFSSAQYIEAASNLKKSILQG
jgi:hypothetical protein